MKIQNKEIEMKKQIINNIRKYWVPLVSILALSLSLYGVICQQTLIDDYQKTLKSLQYHDVRNELVITEFDFTETTKPIPRLYQPVAVFKQDATLEKWTYNFGNNALDLNATFRQISIRFYLPESTYHLFDAITSIFQIEGEIIPITIRREHYEPSTTNYDYYEAVLDISLYMWKEDVPNTITIETILTL